MTWHEPSGKEQLQVRVLLNRGLSADFGVAQLVWVVSFRHGSTLKSQSVFPICVAISSRAATANTNQNPLYI